MTADPSRVAAAHTLLAQLGVSVADLQAAPDRTRRMPTVAEYLPRVMAAATPSSCRTYGTYWTRMAAVWGDWPLDAVAATDVEALQRDCAKHARRRSNDRGGRHAGENLISAARAFYTRAVADGLIPTGTSPAHQVRKPRRLPNPRRALTPPDNTGPATTTYIKTDVQAVATALAALTGQPHPLATTLDNLGIRTR